MLEELPKLKRPGHWRSVLKWVQKIQKKSRLPYTLLSPEDKLHLKVFCIMTGRFERAVHLDFHQSSNIAEFMTLCGSREELRGLMDGTILRILTSMLSQIVVNTFITLSVNATDVNYNSMQMHQDPKQTLVKMSAVELEHSTSM